MNTLADRIRKMAESVDPELIASSLRIPLDIVKGILSGEIPDEILDSYDPGKPPELRVVEKKSLLLRNPHLQVQYLMINRWQGENECQFYIQLHQS